MLMCACDWQIKLHDIRQIQLLKKLELCSIWQLPVYRKLHIRQLYVSLRILNQLVTDAQMTQAIRNIRQPHNIWQPRNRLNLRNMWQSAVDRSCEIFGSCEEDSN